MNDVLFRRKRGQAFSFSSEERAQLDALSDAEIEVAAEADPDNPPVDAARLHRMALAREVRLIRESTGLSQREFAERFHIGLGRVRDFEQARSEPDTVVRVFYRLILEDSAQAERLVAEVQD